MGPPGGLEVIIPATSVDAQYPKALVIPHMPPKEVLILIVLSHKSVC